MKGIDGVNNNSTSDGSHRHDMRLVHRCSQDSRRAAPSGFVRSAELEAQAPQAQSGVSVAPSLGSSLEGVVCLLCGIGGASFVAGTSLSGIGATAVGSLMLGARIFVRSSGSSQKSGEGWGSSRVCSG